MTHEVALSPSSQLSKGVMPRILHYITQRLAWQRVLRLSTKAGYADVDAHAVKIFGAISDVEETTVDLNLDDWVTRMVERGRDTEAESPDDIQLEETLSKLPRSQLLAVLLHNHGLSLPEIAVQLGTQEHDARCELRAALRTLRNG